MAKMTTIFTLFLVVFLASSVFAQQIPQEIPTQPKEKPTIAVTTFENLSAYPENAWVAMSFSESLTVKLKRLYERFRVVERLRVYEVIKEQGFDPEKVDSLEATKQRDIGSLIGVNFLILGSVSLQGLADEPKTKLLANMRTVDVQTGEIKEATSVSGQMQEIFDLEIQLAFAFLKQVGVDITKSEEQQISIKETESLLAEKYYNLGNQYFYDGNLDAAEAWYARAVDLLEGGYYREAALRRVEVLRQQKTAAKTEVEKQQVIDKMRNRIDQINRRRAEADEMLFEQAELLTEVGQYEDAVEAYQLYLERVKPWQPMKWKADISTIPPFFGGRVVVDEKTVYIYSAGISSDETASYRLFALTRENGKLKWKFDVNDKASTSITSGSGVVSAGDFVYFRAGDVLYALEPETGTERWKFEAPQEKKLENAYFKVVERSIYFQSRTGMLYALSGDTGQLKWQLDMMGNLLFVPETPLVISDGVIYINKYDTLRKLSLSALNAETGEALWSAEQYLSANVIIAHSTIYVSSVDGVFALDTETGKLKWQSDRFEGMDIALKGSLLYTAAPFNGDLYALDANTGEVIWKTHVHPPVENVITTYTEPLVVANGVLLYRTSENLYALSAETGEIQWEFGAQGIRAHTVEENAVYLLSDDGFYALNLDAGNIRWQFIDVRSLRDYDVAEDGTVYISTARGVFALNPKPAGYASRSEEADVLVGLGRAKQLMGKYDDAIETLQNALESRTNFPRAYHQLALCYEEMGNWSEATSTWDRYLIASVKQGIIPKEISRHLWELAGVRWVGPGIVYNGEVVVTDDAVYLPSGDGYGYVYALDQETGRVKWRFEGSRSGEWLTQSDDRIYTVDFSLSGGDRTISLDASTGGVRWAFQIERRSLHELPVLGSGETLNYGLPMVSGEVIYVPAELIREYPLLGQTYTERKLYALSVRTGELLWKFEPGGQSQKGQNLFDSNFRQSYLIVGDKIYWNPDFRHLYALSKENGTLKWYFDRGELSSAEASAPVVTEQMVYVAATDALFAVDTETETIAWKAQIPGLQPYSPLAVNGGFVYVAFDKGIYALSANTGEIKWQSKDSKVQTLIVDRGTVYTYGGGLLSAFAADTGEAKWIFPANPTTIALTEQEVYFIENGLYALTQGTGELKWKFQTADSISSIRVANGILYAATPSVLYAFDIAKIDQLLATGKKWWEADVKPHPIPPAPPISAELPPKPPISVERPLKPSVSVDAARRDAILSLMGNRAHPQLDRILEILAYYEQVNFFSTKDEEFLELKQLGKSVVPVLIAYWKVDAQKKPASVGVRDAIIKMMLIEFGDASIIAALNQIVVYKNVATQVLEAGKKQWGPPALIEVLKQLKQASQEPKTSVEILTDFLERYAMSNALCSLGQKEGVEELIHLLEVEDVNVLFYQFRAIKTLAQYTGQDFSSGFDKPQEHRQEIAQKYRAWWEANKDKLSWSTEQKRFVLP